MERHISRRNLLLGVGAIGLGLALDRQVSGISHAAWAVGENALQPLQEAVLARENIDTTSIDIFQPERHIPGLVMAMSSAYCGKENELCDMSVLNQGYDGAYENREAFLLAVRESSNLDIPTNPDELIYLLSHGQEAAQVISEQDIRPNQKNVFYAESAIFKLPPGNIIAFQPVDCAGITMADPITRTIAIIHGNKHIDQTKVVEQTLAKMKSMKIDLSRVFTWIPPSAHIINANSFAEDILNIASGKTASETIDLTALYTERLIQGGIHPQNIEKSEVDTVRSLRMFSYHSARRFIGPDGKRLSIKEGLTNALLKGFGTHMLIAGFVD